MFKITGNKGFHITFKNGITVSVQFGGANYCANDVSISDTPENIQSPDAEVALWNKTGSWITKDFKDEGDDVLGYQTAEDVLVALNWAANQ